jgi:endogenous inhibitor of DNA gyrase (YacG/DUF329 family)
MSEPRPDPPAPDSGAHLCAICGKPQASRFKPFCSKRCADVDLGRWLKGSYAIPTRELPETATDEGGEGET